MAAPRRTLPPLVVLILLLLGAAVWLVSQDAETPAVEPGSRPEATETGRVTKSARPMPERPGPARERVETRDESVNETPAESDVEYEFPDAKPLPPRTLDVTVVREDGGPVRDAHVAAATSFGTLAVSAEEAVTDVEGKVTLQLGGASIFRVRAWTRDAAGFSERVSLAPGASGAVTVRIVPGRRVRGVVASSEGGAVPGLPGAKVTLSLATDDPFGLRVAVEAGRGGAFDLGIVPENRLLDRKTTIRADAEHHASLEAPFSDYADAAEVRLELERGQTVRGRCITGSGLPVPGVPMWLSEANQRTGDDGRFEFTGVARTGGSLVMRPRDHAMPRPIDIAAGHGEIDVGDVVLERGRPIAGTVVDAADAPVAGAVIRAWRVDWGLEVASATADENGVFELAHVGESAHTLVVSGGAGGWTSKIVTTVGDVTAGTTGLRVVLSGGLSLLITFKNEADRSPVSVAAAEVTAWRTDIDTDRRGRAWAGSSIKTVRITLDAPGTYAVEVSIPGYEPATVEGIEISADRETTIDALLRQKTE